VRPASRLRRVLLAGHRFDFDAPDRGVSGAALDARNLFRRNARREARAEQAQRPALFVGVRDFPRRAADDRRGVIRRQARLVDRGAVHEERADLRVLPEQLGLEALGGGVVVSRVMRKFDLALAEIYFRGRVHAPWLPSSGQGAKGQGRRYAARLALDAL